MQVQINLKTPHIFSPVWFCAIAMALSFYSQASLLPMLIMSTVLASVATVLHMHCGRAGQIWAFMVGALALGLVLGYTVQLGDSHAVHDLKLAPQFARRVSVVEGYLEQDATMTSKGGRLYYLRVTHVTSKSPSGTTVLETEGSTRLLIKEGPALTAGEFLRATGNFPNNTQKTKVTDASSNTKVTKVTQNTNYTKHTQDSSNTKLTANSKNTNVPQNVNNTAISDNPSAIFFAKKIEVLPYSTMMGSGFFARLQSYLHASRVFLRSHFLQGLRSAGGERAQGLLEALLSGSKDTLEQDIALDFKQAGASHILALSGQHLSLLAAAIAFIFGRLIGPRKAKILAVIFASLYVFIVGPGPSLLRSLVMFCIAAFLFFIEREQNSRSILAFSFIITLIADPHTAYTLGYTLSYLALVGLIVFTPRFKNICLPIFPPKIALALAVSLAAQLVTTPLLIMSFHILYPIGLLASMAVELLVVVFMYWGLAASIICSFVPSLGAILSIPTQILHYIFTGAMHFFARAPGITFTDASATYTSIGFIVAAILVYYQAQIAATDWPKLFSGIKKVMQLKFERG